MSMNVRKGNEYYAINNAIDKQLSEVKMFVPWV